MSLQSSVALKGASISAWNHNLAGMGFDAISDASRGWTAYLELTVPGLHGTVGHGDLRGLCHTWSRMCDQPSGYNLVTTEPALAS